MSVRSPHVAAPWHPHLHRPPGRPGRSPISPPRPRVPSTFPPPPPPPPPPSSLLPLLGTLSPDDEGRLSPSQRRPLPLPRTGLRWPPTNKRIGRTAKDRSTEGANANVSENLSFVYSEERWMEYCSPTPATSEMKCPFFRRFIQGSSTTRPTSFGNRSPLWPPGGGGWRRPFSAPYR